MIYRISLEAINFTTIGYPRRLLYTQGIQHVMEHGEADWLINEIFFAQIKAVVRNEEFHVWHLQPLQSGAAWLVCVDVSIAL